MCPAESRVVAERSIQPRVTNEGQPCSCASDGGKGAHRGTCPDVDGERFLRGLVEVNLRAEMEIMGLHAKLDAVREREWKEFLQMQREQLDVLRRIEAGLLGAGNTRRSPERP